MPTTKEDEIRREFAALQTLREARKPRVVGTVLVDTATVQFAFMPGARMRDAGRFWHRVRTESMSTATLAFDGRVGAVYTEADGEYEVVVTGEPMKLPFRTFPVPAGARRIVFGDCGKAQVAVEIPHGRGSISLCLDGAKLYVGI